MTCTIIIYDYNSLPFLRACVRQIEKYKHPDIDQTILISEQGSAETYHKARDLFGGCVHSLLPLGSGYAIDYFMRSGLVTTDYVCTLDVDAFPIHRNWLKVPITLCEDQGFHFSGVHAEIESAYGGGFFCMCQYFRVGRTEDFMKLSLGGGFTKWDQRKLTGMKFDDRGWHTGSRAWSDDAVIAHWWEDHNLQHKKFTFATLQYLDVAPSEGRYGRNTDDLVFHFAFSYNAHQVAKPIEALGQNYWDWLYRINVSDFAEELLDEMMSKLIPLEIPIYRRLWDGGQVKSADENLNKIIDNLKNS